MRVPARKLVLVVVIVLIAGILALCGTWVLRKVFKYRPANYTEAGVIVAAGRVIPDQIVLDSTRAARLHLVSIGEGTSVRIVGKDSRTVATVSIEPGQVRSVVLSRRMVQDLGNGELRADNRAARIVVRPPAENAAVPSSSTDLAVVMTNLLAAPKSITLRKGVPVTLFITKTPSEVSFDVFECKALDIRLEVEDNKLSEVKLTPDKTGDFEFLGTVTPDSKVVLHVVE